jgi:hypothetical protein
MAAMFTELRSILVKYEVHDDIIGLAVPRGTLFGRVWGCLHPFGRHCEVVTLFGRVWGCLQPFGRHCEVVTLFGRVWGCCNPFGRHCEDGTMGASAMHLLMKTRFPPVAIFHPSPFSILRLAPYFLNHGVPGAVHDGGVIAELGASGSAVAPL